VSADLLTLEEAASLLQRSPLTVYRHYVYRQRLRPASRRGSRLLYRRADVEALRSELEAARPLRPKPRPMTRRQRQCLYWFAHHWRHYGCAPSLRELAHALGVRDHRWAQELLRSLVERGTIEQDAEGVYRPRQRPKQDANPQPPNPDLAQPVSG
jgi:hypothetical protein